MGVLDFLNFGLKAGTEVLNQFNQKRSWDREDNAVQRRVADLKAAGLSPVLAAGSAASSSAPIRVTAPQFNADVEQQSAGIGQTRAQTELNKHAIAKIDTDRDIALANSMDSFIKQHGWLGLEGADREAYSRELLRSDLDRRITENREYVRGAQIYGKYDLPFLGPNNEYVNDMQMMGNVIPGLDSGKGAGVGVMGRILMDLAKGFFGRGGKK